MEATRYRNVKLPSLENPDEMVRMCNACANYYWMKGEMRPKHLWNLGHPKRRRNRKKSEQATKQREDDGDAAYKGPAGINVMVKRQKLDGDMDAAKTATGASASSSQDSAVNADDHMNNEPIASRIKIRLLRRRSQNMALSELIAAAEEEEEEEEEEELMHGEDGGEDYVEEDAELQQTHSDGEQQTDSQDQNQQEPISVYRRTTNKPLHQWTSEELQNFLSRFATPTSVNNPHDLVAREHIDGATMYDMVSTFDTITMAKALKVSFDSSSSSSFFSRFERVQ